MIKISNRLLGLLLACGCSLFPSTGYCHFTKAIVRSLDKPALDAALRDGNVLVEHLSKQQVRELTQVQVESHIGNPAFPRAFLSKLQVQALSAEKLTQTLELGGLPIQFLSKNQVRVLTAEQVATQIENPNVRKFLSKVQVRALSSAKVTQAFELGEFPLQFLSKNQVRGLNADQVAQKVTDPKFPRAFLSKVQVRALSSENLAAALALGDVPFQQSLQSFSGVDRLFERIGIVPLRNSGLTGKGTNVAIFDSGVNQGDALLQGKVVQGAGFAIHPFGDIHDYDQYYNRPATRHGTNIALILAGSRSSKNQEGISPGVGIAPFTDLEGQDFLAAIRYAHIQLGVQVVNISLQNITFEKLGIYFPKTGEYAKETPDVAIVVIASNGGKEKQATMAQGLKGGSPFFYPETGNIIVTVGVDEKDQLRDKSRFCGRVRRFCVAVPSPDTTSPTAPVVSGAIALLREAVPGLPMRNYVEAILQTASNPKEPTIETGVGLMNVEAALRYLEKFKE